MSFASLTERLGGLTAALPLVLIAVTCAEVALRIAGLPENVRAVLRVVRMAGFAVLLLCVVIVLLPVLRIIGRDALGL